MRFSQFTSIARGVLCLISVPLAHASNQLLVHLTSGNFLGEASAVNATERWLGIPFAQPPLGTLRFKAPVPISIPVKGVQNATKFGDACPKLPSATTFGTQSENCLSLNVWRPIGTRSKDKLPALVWFYVNAVLNWENNFTEWRS